MEPAREAVQRDAAARFHTSPRATPHAPKRVSLWKRISIIGAFHQSKPSFQSVAAAELPTCVIASMI